MGRILDFLDEAEYRSWKEEERARERKLKEAETSPQQPTAWQQAMSQPEPSRPFGPLPAGYYPRLAPEPMPEPVAPPEPPPMTAWQRAFAPPQMDRNPREMPPVEPVAPPMPFDLSRSHRQPTLGERNEGLRQALPGYAGTSDVAGEALGAGMEGLELLRQKGIQSATMIGDAAGDVAGVTTPRTGLSRSNFDTRRPMAIEEEAQKGITGLLPVGPARGIAGGIGQVLNDAVTGGGLAGDLEAVKAGMMTPEQIKLKQAERQKQLPEDWQRWQQETNNPLIEGIFDPTNLIPIPGAGPALNVARQGLQATRTGAQAVRRGAEAVSPVLRNTAREMGPVARGLLAGERGGAELGDVVGKSVEDISKGKPPFEDFIKQYADHERRLKIAEEKPLLLRGLRNAKEELDKAQAAGKPRVIKQQERAVSDLEQRVQLNLNGKFADEEQATFDIRNRLEQRYKRTYPEGEPPKPSTVPEQATATEAPTPAAPVGEAATKLEPPSAPTVPAPEANLPTSATGQGKQPWEMSDTEWKQVITEGEPAPTTTVENIVDWGRQRHQGKRTGGGMVTGAMGDVSLQGKKTYLTAVPLDHAEPGVGLNKTIGQEFITLDQHGRLVYLRARQGGMSHKASMAEGLSLSADMEGRGLNGHKLAVEQALSDGLPVPQEIINDYPDLAAKVKSATAPEQAAQAIEQPVGVPEAATEGKVVRFEAGKKLTKDERQQVLRSVVDVYKANNVEKVSKGINKYGDEVMGYPYAPEYFAKSDITGMQVRYFIRLPNGKIAHPSELFPSMGDSAIKRYMEEEASKSAREAKEAASWAKVKNARIIEAGPQAKGDAIGAYIKSGRGRQNLSETQEKFLERNRQAYFAQDDKGRIVRVDGSDPKDVEYFENQGFKPISIKVKDVGGEATPEPATPLVTANAPTDAVPTPEAASPMSWNVTVRQSIILPGRKIAEPLDRVLTVNANTQAQAIKAVKDMSGVKGQVVRAVKNTPPVQPITAPVPTPEQAVAPTQAAVEVQPAQPLTIATGRAQRQMRQGGPLPPRPVQQAPTTGAANVPPQPPATPPVQPPTPPEKPGFAGNIRLSKYPEELRAELKAVYEANPEKFEAARRGVRSDEQVRTDAEALISSVGGNLNKRMKAWQKGQAWNAEEVLALREVLANKTKAVVEAQKAVRQIDSTANLANLRLALEEQNAVQEVVAGVTAEAGRTLRQFRQSLSGAIQSGDEQRIKAILEKFGGRGRAEELAQALSNVDLNDQDAVYRLIRNSLKPKAADYLTEIFYNSILSGPRTHIVNAIGNTLAAITAPVETAVAGAIDIPLSALQGRPRERFVREAIPEVFGMARALPEGVTKALYVLKNGYSWDDVAKLEIRRTQAFKGKPGAVLNMPTRELAASDALFRSINYGGAINAHAYRMARKEGLQGQPLAERIAELLADPPQALLQSAGKMSSYRVFQQSPGQVARGLVTVRDVEMAGVQPLRFALPFIQTPANLLKYGMERSPLGWLNPKLWQNVARKNPEAADQMARAFIGSTIAGAIAVYAAEGKLTADAPTSQSERDAFYRSGKQPFAVKIGDKWIPYNRLEPFNQPLAQVAGVVDALKKGDTAPLDLIGQVVATIGSNLVSQTYMSGLSDLMNALKDPERYGANLIERTAIGMAVPFSSLTRTATQMGDTTIRQPEGLVEELQAGIPGQSQKIPAKLNAWGEEITREAPAWSPLNITTDKADPIDQELARLQINVGFVGDRIQGIALSREEKDTYQRLSGRLTRQLLEKVTANALYAQQPDAAKAKILEGIIRKGRDMASNAMRQQLGTERLKEAR